jgi:hypothetical protein
MKVLDKVKKVLDLILSTGEETGTADDGLKQAPSLPNHDEATATPSTEAMIEEVTA